MIRLGTVLLLVTPAAGQPRSTAPSSQSASVRAGGEQPAPSLVFNSAAMLEVLDMVESVAASPLSVLLLGETGVGKEVLAEEIHRRSPRANNPLVRLNCAVLSESLLESELFGHEKGAFTGATGTKRGLLETAHEGTVFLDEVGELSPSIQVKLLRVLEERRVTRVGALRSRAIDVRFIAATNRNLEHEIDNERFRRDLFFRLNGVKIIIPPLRARLEEIEGLAQLFIERISRQLGRAAAPALSARALRILREHGWPGNVRELRNTVERAAVLCKGDVIEPEHLLLDPPPSASAAPASSLMGAPRAGPVAPAGEPRHALSFADPTTASLPGEVEALERRRIVEALERCCGNQTHAARMLGISRNKLLARIAYFGLPRPRSPRG
jgi:transcriptional regulator with GAF, ATPase, and Fis domain